MRTILSTADSVALAARSWRTPTSPPAAVVLVHGFCAGADDPQVVAVAEALHADGLDVVTYDARGHGASEGETTLGDRERHDVEAAVVLARQRADRVVVVGASMGAIAALRYAAEADDGVDRLAGVVAVSCPARWRLPATPTAILAAAMTRTALGRAAARRFLQVRIATTWDNPAPPVELVGRITAPLAIVHGRADRFIPAGNARLLHAGAQGLATLDLVEGMGHAYSEAAVAPIRRAVAWALASSDRAAGSRRA